MIGLFPLELVLVPTERIPLTVFEPRYLELVGECIETGEEFGIVQLKPSGDIHHVGTRAAVDEVLQVLPDGRMHVVVEGGHDRPFATAFVEELADEDDPPDPADVAKALESFRRLQETIGAPGEPPDPNAVELDFELIGRVDFSAERKQELLELTSPRIRFARLAELLEHALEAMRLEQEMRQRAHGNGKVTPLAP